MNDTTVLANQASHDDTKVLTMGEFDPVRGDQRQTSSSPSHTFELSPYTTGELLDLKPTMSFDEYLGQNTRGRYITPEASESVVAQHIAIICKDVLRYNADLDEWYAWNGQVWLKTPGAEEKAISALLHKRIGADGTEVPAKIQPYRYLSGQEKADSLDDALSAGKATKRQGEYYEPDSLNPYLPVGPVKNWDTQQKVTSLSKLLRWTPGINARNDEFNAHPDVVPLQGTYLRINDLKPGTNEGIVEPDPEMLVTEPVAAPLYMEDISDSEWVRFLESSLPDLEVREYLQRVAGAALNGGYDQQELYVLTGEGANGKSVLVEVITHALGSFYAASLPDTVIQAKGKNEHPTELMGLKNARFAFASETSDSGLWNTPILKKLTGGDSIPARGMRQDFEVITPTHTLFIATNERPNVPAGEQAFWRRYREINFPVKFVDADERDLKPNERVRDSELKAKLLEHPEIVICWLVQGWYKFLQDGKKFHPPASVIEAGKEAKSEGSPFSMYARECYEVTNDPAHSVPASVVFDLWKAYGNKRTTMQRFYPSRVQDMKKLASELGVDYRRRQESTSNRQPAAVVGVRLTEDCIDLIPDVMIDPRAAKSTQVFLKGEKERLGL